MNTIMGVIFGIVCFAVIVPVLICSRGNRGRNPLIYPGLARIAIGAIGIFFGRQIVEG